MKKLSFKASAPFWFKVSAFLCTSFLFASCFTVTTAPSGGSGSGSGTKPIASFYYVPGTNGNVTFSNASLYATSYSWDFGDLTAYSTLEAPTHQYTTNGTYTVYLTATNSSGSNTYSMDVVISNAGGGGGGGGGSTLTFTNTTFTPVSLTVNGQLQTIAVSANGVYSGTPSASATVTGSTSGTTSTGTQVGVLVSWSFSSTFPVSGNTSSNLIVGPSLFFLKIRNTSAYTITKVYVNYGLADQTLDNISIPNNGVTYWVGYYKSFSNSNVRMESGAHIWTFNSTSLALTHANNDVTVLNPI